MPVEMDTRAVAEEQGSFQQPAALPCEACSACGLCEITSTKIDFMGNISDLSDVDEAEKPKLEMLFKMAGFEQKIQNWDESVGDTGKFEFTRFGRTFKGELSRYGDITLSVELAQNPAAMMEKFHQVQQSAVTISAETQSNMQQNSEPMKSRQTEKPVVKESESLTSEPIIEVSTTSRDSVYVSDIRIAMTGDYPDEEQYEPPQHEVTHAATDRTFVASEKNTVDTDAIQYTQYEEADEAPTVLPSNKEFLEWQQEKPFEDWQVTPLRGETFDFEDPIHPEAVIIHTESTYNNPPNETAPESGVSISVNTITPEQDVFHTEIITPPAPPDRDDVLSMVETHKHAEREMFTFVSEIQSTIETHQSSASTTEISTQTPVIVDSVKPNAQMKEKNIVFVPTNQSEHVIMQYLIAAKARIQLASGHIEFQSKEDTRGDISVKKHMYSISYHGNEYTVTLVRNKDATLEIIGTLEALRALGIILLELQLAQTKNAHANIPDTLETETAPEELDPVTTQHMYSFDVDEFLYFLRYILYMTVSNEIEKSQLLHMCL